MQYPGQESTRLEFKKELPKNQQVIKTCVAFCNVQGGKIVIGVADDGEIIGIPETEIENAIMSLQQAIYQSCTPPVLPSVYAQRIQDKLLLIVEVSMGMNKPYFLTHEGLAEGTYIRVGTHTHKATSEAISELKWQARGHSLDELPVYAAKLNNLDDESLGSFIEKRAKNLTSKQKQELLIHYKLLVEEHQQQYPSVASILLFGKDPQHFLNEAFIICTHFKGIIGRHVLATRDCTGTLFTQLNDALAFIQNRLHKQFVIKKTKREEKLEIPEIALREIITNALIHRNYQIHGPCKIAIYDDRVEIFSPGAFPGPLQIDQLEQGITYIRNRIIARIFREMGLVEKLGSGFSTLFSSYQAAGLTIPQVINGANFVKCILPRAASSDAKEMALDDTNKVMLLFNGAEKISVQDIMTYCRVSRSTAVRLLHELVDKNFITRVGKGPMTRYKKN